MGLVITREEALMPAYSPDCALHREGELKEINEAIKPLFEGRQPENLFIYGNPGTGKTACILHVLRELEGRSSRVKPIYVNCWQHSTRMAIYSLISRAIDEMMPRRGLARDEVYGRIVEIMEKEGIRVLLVLDGIDSLFRQGEERLLEDIGMTEKPIFGAICISNNAQLLAGRDIRLTGMEFRQYSMAQMADILSERARVALVPGSWDKQVIEACAAKARNSNVREGLEVLWMAAKRAEKEGRTRITLRDVNAACGWSKLDTQQEKEVAFPSAGLSNEERLILDIVKSGPKSSTDLYRAFFKKANKSKRQIRNYLSRLEAKKLLLIEPVVGESLLNTRRIGLNVSGCV